MASWIVEGVRTVGPEKGKTIMAVVESTELETEEEARLFGAGQLRGMGYVVDSVQVWRTKESE